MMLRKTVFLSLLLVPLMSLTLLLAPATAQAATERHCGQTSRFFGFPTWYKYLVPTFDSKTNQCEITFNFPKDIGLVIAAGIEILLRVAMLAAIGFVLFGGVQFIMSQGEPDRISTARGTIVNALIGLVIAIVATSVVTFIAGRFRG